MAESVDAHPIRLTFLILSVLLAANLILVIYTIASSNVSAGRQIKTISLQTAFQKFEKMTAFSHTVHDGNMSSFRSATEHCFSYFGGMASGGITYLDRATNDSLHTLIHAASNVSIIATKATNIDTYIKPADYVHVPKIAPLPDPPVVKIAATTPIPQPVPPAQTISNPITHTQESINSTPIRFSTINTYAWGNCTWWAAKRRAQVGGPIPNSWGNAATWASRAASNGYIVDHHPSPDAVMQTPYSAGGLGHVAFVESVDEDGTWHISEMNVLGLDVVDHKAEPPSAAADYSFIHDRN